MSVYYFVTNVSILITNVYDLVTNVYDLVTNVYDLVTNVYDIVTNVYDIVTKVYGCVQIEIRLFRFSFVCLFVCLISNGILKQTNKHHFDICGRIHEGRRL